MMKQQPEGVAEELSKPYYDAKKFLELAKREENLPAMAVLYLRLQSYDEALEANLQLVDRHYERLVDEAKKLQFESNRGSLRRYFRAALDVCKKSSADHQDNKEPWYKTLDRIYKKLIDVHERNGNLDRTGARAAVLGALYDRIADFLTGSTKEILSEMVKYIGFTELLCRMADRYGELEVGNSKDILSYILSSYSYQREILRTATEVCSRYLHKELEQFCRASSRGFNVLEPSLCAKCARPTVASADSQLVAFSCGHVFHEACADFAHGCENCVSVVRTALGKKEEAKGWGESSGGVRRIDISADGETAPAQSVYSSVAVSSGKRKKKLFKKMEIFERMRMKSHVLLSEQTGK